MKRVSASLSFVAAIATVAVVAAPAGAASPPDISRGSVKLNLPTVFGPLPAHLVSSAKSDPAPGGSTGPNAQGHFRTTLDASGIGLGPREVIAGIVTCLNVTQTSPTSTRSVIGGMITLSTQPAIIPPGTGTLAMHVDNGSGANDPPDQVESSATLGAPQTVCPETFTGPQGLAPIDQGNWINVDRLAGL